MAKLVAIGDSLTQGFQSLAITHVDLSYPAIVARCMGLDVDTFATPDFSGSGGLPCNLEWLARKIEQRIPAGIGLFGWAAAAFEIVELLDQVEEYWERGPGSRPGRDTLYHNLAIWGYEAGDAHGIDASEAYDLASKAVKQEWLHPPSEPRMRTAWRVLNPALSPLRDADTQISVAKRICARDGEIENLIVWLGANNCLGTVVRLDVRETPDAPPGPFSDFTLWTPSAFQTEYEALAKETEEIGAKNVFLATVPHVTIPPVTKGLMADGATVLPPGEKYFDYYVRFFVDPSSFVPAREDHLTKADAIKIDGYIDAYNATIAAAAAKRGWHVVDTCRLLDDLAVKRNHGKPKDILPPAFTDLDVRFLMLDASGRRTSGGLISLDGVHPTTSGYAVVAREFIRTMNAATGTSIPEPDYPSIRRLDSLVSSPPRTLADAEGMLRVLEERFHLSRWMHAAH